MERQDTSDSGTFSNKMFVFLDERRAVYPTVSLDACEDMMVWKVDKQMVSMGGEQCLMGCTPSGGQGQGE